MADCNGNLEVKKYFFKWAIPGLFLLGNYVFKWAIPRLYFFIFVFLYNLMLTGNNGSMNFADDWIRTLVLWYRKRLRCQL